MEYSEKSVEEIIQAFKNRPDEEFFPYLRHDSLHFVLHIERSAELLEELLSDQQLDKELAFELVEIIKNSSGTLRKMMDALIGYDQANQNS